MPDAKNPRRDVRLPFARMADVGGKPTWPRGGFAVPASISHAERIELKHLIEGAIREGASFRQFGRQVARRGFGDLLNSEASFR